MKNSVIITICDIGNYGNRLQNYAVINILNSLNVKCINYQPYNKFYNFSKILYNICKCNFKKAHRLFLSYSVDCKMSKYIYTEKIMKRNINKYDYFICGSDQIWNPNFAGTDYCFADFAPSEKRIAYSASFGVDNISEENKEKYINSLNGMKAISVREKTGANIVKELTGRDSEVLIDPTLMVDKKDWSNIARKPKFNTSKKYVFTYFLGKISQETQEYIDSICQNNNLSLIDLNRQKSNKYWNNTTCLEFLWLIEHSEIVLTDSFHGSVFSMLMEKPFVVFERMGSSNMGSRLDTLLKTFKLENRKYENLSVQDAFKIDCSHVNKILEKEREKAIVFLKNAMEIS